MTVRTVLLGAALAVGIVVAATPLTSRAGDCAGGVDATGNECNAGLAAVTAASTQGDVARFEAAQAAAKLTALRTDVKQRELKVVVAKNTLRSVEIDLASAQETLEDYEKSLAKSRALR